MADVKPDLKRKRNSAEGSEAAPTVVSDPPYFAGLPEGFADLADLALLVEGERLPAHSFVLTRRSPVLLTAFTTARQEELKRVYEIPLPGETKKRLILVLKYLYQENLAIESLSDASILVTFAHKYNMTYIWRLSSMYLEENVSKNIGVSTAFDWAHFAERNNLTKLLAQCELYIARNYRDMSSEHKKLSSISQNSLLRIMDCLACKGAVTSKDDLEKQVQVTGQLWFRPCCKSVGVSERCTPSAVTSVCYNNSSYSQKGLKVNALTETAAPILIDVCMPDADVLQKWQEA